MEAEEDGIVVVIIGDDGEESQDVSPGSESIPLLTHIKTEPQENAGSFSLVTELLETAEKHGEYLDVDHLPFINQIKEEPIFYEYLDQARSFQRELNDSDYTSDVELQESNKSCDEEYNNDKKPKKKYRREMVGPTEIKSYVNKLRKKHPEVSTNPKEFVQLIADTMKSIKPPPPPADFYRIRELNYECIECGHKSNRLAAATRHYQEYHGPRYLKCFACGVDFRSLTNLYKHEKRCRGPDAVVVLKARALAVARRGQNRPFLVPKQKNKKGKYDNTKIFDCAECSAQFKTKMGLTSHLHLHRGERPYACEVCGAAYTNRNALRRHQELHKNKKYICDHCNKVFRMKNALQYHMDTHLPQRKFPCPLLGCGRRFAQKQALNIHINGRHRNLPAPCPCQICPKRFPRMSVLKVHMRKEHGMILMTRNMFFKTLPTLSDTQVQQAKLVFQDNLENGMAIAPDEEINDIETPNVENTEYNIEPDSILPDLDNSGSAVETDVEPYLELVGPSEDEEDVLELVQRLLKEKSESVSKGGKILVIENGQVKNISKKSKFRKQYEELIAKANSDDCRTKGSSMPTL